jgi:hypothetical protein
MTLQSVFRFKGVAMTGRRLPVIGHGKPTMPTEPGDYCGPVMGCTGDKPAVFFLPPNARESGNDRPVHHVVSPPHGFEENPGGALTIRESVLSPTYHGFLENGIWLDA